MIKRLGKAKKKKQGAILVIVVLILALAMIFISMAMLLTKATRNRLYENAMSSQARLTVTSAAEVFLEALQTQEITDKQMDGYLSESPTKADGKMLMVIDGVPGMTRDPKNCTTLNIYFPDKTSKPTVVYCDFTTTIGDQVENVRVELSIAPQEETKPSDRFSNQIDQYCMAGDSRFFFEGGIGNIRNSSVTPTDNTVLLRNGNATTTASGGIFYSDMVFADGAVFRGDSVEYHGDMIFLGDAHIESRKPLNNTYTGNMFFLGNNGKPGFMLNESDPDNQIANLWSKVRPENIVFDGRIAANDDKDGYIKQVVTDADVNCYFLNEASGELTGKANGYKVKNVSGSLPTDLQTKYNTVSQYDYTDSGNKFPTDIVSDVFKKMNPDGQVLVAGENTVLDYDTFSADGTQTFKKGEAITAGEKYIVNPLTSTYPAYKYDAENKIPSDNIITLSSNSTLGTLDGEDGYNDRIIDLDPGYYYLKPGTLTAGNNTNCTISYGDGNYKPYVIAIDGSRGGEYRFYFAPGDYCMACLVFAIYNPDTSEPVVFILEPGAHVNWGGYTNDLADTSSLCTSGIISIDRTYDVDDSYGDYKEAQAIGDYIHSTTMDSEIGDVTDDQYKFSAYYDGVVKPCAYLFGSSSNASGAAQTYIEWGNVNSIFEAYIGMYGANSTVKSRDGNYKFWIYGRIETYNVENYNTSMHQWYMPYCPGPANNTEPLPDERPAETKYKVASITYYYGTGIPEAEAEGEGG